MVKFLKTYESMELFIILILLSPLRDMAEENRILPFSTMRHFLLKYQRPIVHMWVIELRRDILGSNKAGYRLAIQIIHDFDHGEIDEGAQPDAVIHSMDELINIIQVENLQKTSSPSDDHPIKAFLFDAGDILYHRPKRGHHLRSFLNEIGISEIEIPRDKKKELRDLAYKGLINQSQQRKAIMQYYGVTDPELVERGCQALEDDDNKVQFFPGVQETLKALNIMDIFWVS